MKHMTDHDLALEVRHLRDRLGAIEAEQQRRARALSNQLLGTEGASLVEKITREVLNQPTAMRQMFVLTKYHQVESKTALSED